MLIEMKQDSIGTDVFCSCHKCSCLVIFCKIAVIIKKKYNNNVQTYFIPNFKFKFVYPSWTSSVCQIIIAVPIRNLKSIFWIENKKVTYKSCTSSNY